MKNEILERFLRYIKIDTQSDESSSNYPSSEKQRMLGNLLIEELKTLGLKDVTVDKYGYIMATLPSNVSKKVPVIGFLAHMDTSPDMSGENVKPRIIENYDGSDIVLSKEKQLVMTTREFPELKKYVGQTIITTDGNTLLGADDKAGIAEIMAAVSYLLKHPEIKHGDIRIGFTHDEEIGHGVDFFDVKRFAADFAYTMDGGAIGEMEYENFNAAGAKIAIQGRNIHPGYAKDKMINAMLVAMELNSMLPVNERPEFTQDYDGFYHLIHMEGSVENATIQYIIRDHNRTKFETKKELLTSIIRLLNMKYGDTIVTIDMKDQYYNMKEKVEPHMHIVTTAVKAMEMANIKPLVVPIRGGTDGARLSYMGLPCPNIFAGGHNFHGKFEYVPLESMVKATEVIVNIVKLYAEA
ncbi:MAG TPA: peptidase T [Williamwhitmania sp.]|nr:peptidase T [Williamwhitmania sp.]